jgi:hypothetical protein
MEMRRRHHYGLALSVLSLRLMQFCKYRGDMLAAFGGRKDRWLLTTLVIAELARKLSHPVRYVKRRWLRWSQTLNQISAFVHL